MSTCSVINGARRVSGGTLARVSTLFLTGCQEGVGISEQEPLLAGSSDPSNELHGLGFKKEALAPAQPLLTRTGKHLQSAHSHTVSSSATLVTAKGAF